MRAKIAAYTSLQLTLKLANAMPTTLQSPTFALALAPTLALAPANGIAL